MKRVGNKSGQLVRSASRRGKTSARFQFDITVDKIYGTKAGGSYFVKWARGVKVASTKHCPSTKETAGKAGLPVNQKISLLVTLYREEGKKFDAKDAKLSVVLVNSKKQERTAAKIHFDLSAYAGVPSASSNKLFKLSDKISIRAVVDSRFIKSGTGGPGSAGASSALSGISGRSSDEDEGDDDFDDLALDDVPEPEVTTANTGKSRKPPSIGRQSSTGSSSKVPLLVESPRIAGSSVTTDRRKASSAAAPPSPGASRGVSPAAARVKRGKSGSASAEAKESPRAAEDGIMDKLRTENERLSSELKRAADKQRRIDESHVQEVERLKEQITTQSKEASNTASLRASSDASLDLLSSKNSDLQSQVDSLTKELGVLNRERDSLQLKCRDLSTMERKNRDLSREVDRLTIAMSDSSNTSRGVDVNPDVEERMAQLRKEKEDLELKLKKHEGHYQKIKETYEQLSGMYNKLRSEHVALRDEAAKSREASRKATEVSSGGSEELLSQLDEARHELHDVRASKRSLESDHQRVVGQVSVLQERLDNTTQSLEKAQKEAEDLYAEGEELKSQRDAAMKRALSKGKEGPNGDTTSSRSLGKGEEELRIAKEKLEREQSRLTRRVAELETEIVDLREDIEYEKNEKSKAREDRDKIRESARALERRTSQAAQQSDAVHSLRRKLSTHQQREQDHESMISDLRDEIARLQDELDSSRKSKSGGSGVPNEDVDAILQILVPTKLALAEAEEEKLHLQFSMKKLKKSEKAIQQRLASHASRLEVKLGLATEELETLRRRHNMMDSSGYNELNLDVDY